MTMSNDQQRLLAREFSVSWGNLCRRAKHLRNFGGETSPVASELFEEAFIFTNKRFSNLEHLIGFGGTSGWYEARDKWYVPNHPLVKLAKEALGRKKLSEKFDKEYPQVLHHLPITHPLKETIALNARGATIDASLLEQQWIPVKEAPPQKPIKVHFTKERNQMQTYTKAIVLTIGNSLEGIVIPFSEDVLNVLMAARVVNTKRGSGAQSSDTIHYTPDHASPKVVVVRSSDVTSAPVPKAEKLLIAEKEIADLEERLELVKRSKQEIAATY